MPPHGRVTALIVALLVVATTAAPQNASMSANTGSGSQSDDGKTLTADGRAGIIVGVTMGVFGFVGYVLYEALTKRKSVWRKWFTKLFKQPAGTRTPEGMVIPRPPAAPMPNTPGYEIPRILNYERPSTNGYFLYREETTQGYELTPQTSKPDSSSIVVADAPPTIPPVTTTSSAATTTGLSSSAGADASPAPPALTPGSSSSATADTPPARPPAVTGSATSTTGTSSNVSADTPPAPPAMIAGSSVGATGFSSSATADAPPAAPAVTSTGTTGTSSSMPADALSTAAAVTAASSSLVSTDARPAASTMTSTEDHPAPANATTVASSKVSAEASPAAPLTDSTPAPPQPERTATPPPTTIQEPANWLTIRSALGETGYQDLLRMKGKWFSRARERREKRRVSDNPLVKHGLRWELVETSEDLPSDALSCWEEQGIRPVYAARGIGVKFRGRLSKPGMIVNGLRKKTGAVESQQGPNGSEWLGPPYEVLCGPKGAVELILQESGQWRTPYSPTMLVVEDTFDDFPIFSGIRELRHGGIRLMEASSVRDQIYMNYDYLHLRDGFVSKDPGLLVLGDLPQVQGLPEGVEHTVSYEVGGRPITFHYQA